MRLTKLLAALAVAMLGLGGPRAALAVQDHTAVVAHTVSVSDDGSVVTFELSDGRTTVIEFTSGNVSVDGKVVASYSADADSELMQRWNELLAQAGSLDSTELLQAIRELQLELAERDLVAQEAILAEEAFVELLAAQEAQAATQVAAAEAAEHAAEIAAHAAAQAVLNQELIQESIQGALDAVDGIVIDLSALAESEAIQDQLESIESLGLLADNAEVRVGDVTVPRGKTIDRNLIVISGDVSVFGTVTGNVVALEGDVILRRSGVIGGDVVTVNGTVIRAGGTIEGRVRTEQGLAPYRPRVARRHEPSRRSFSSDPPVHIASLLGMFVALASIGFGMTYFTPRQLDVVSNTVTGSFGKSFLAGMFAQPLLLPMFAMLVAGLAITIVGILLIPVVAVAFMVGLALASVGGYLAVARSLGGSYLARKAARGDAVRETPFRSVLFGLIGLMSIWVPLVLLGWIPVVGQVLFALASIFTWFMATAGFGAIILSRAGLRATFARPSHSPALTDEHYWPNITGEHRQIRPRTRER